MVTRRASRHLALEILYEADIREGSMDVVVSRRAGEAAFPYASKLLDGIAANRTEIDALISRHSLGWSLKRMPVVDRNILRIALYELIYDEDVPAAVAIDEAVDLAKELSTADSGRFVNGVLSRVAEIQSGSEPVL